MEATSIPAYPEATDAARTLRDGRVCYGVACLADILPVCPTQPVACYTNIDRYPDTTLSNEVTRTHSHAVGTTVHPQVRSRGSERKTFMLSGWLHTRNNYDEENNNSFKIIVILL